MEQTNGDVVVAGEDLLRETLRGAQLADSLHSPHLYFTVSCWGHASPGLLPTKDSAHQDTGAGPFLSSWDAFDFYSPHGVGQDSLKTLFLLVNIFSLSSSIDARPASLPEASA